MAKKHFKCGQNKIILNKTRFVNSTSERVILIDDTTKISEPMKALESSMRRQTFLVGEKENIPNLENNMFGHDTIFAGTENDLKRPNKIYKYTAVNNPLNAQNANHNIMSDDSLDESFNKLISTNSPFNDFCLTPLKSTENLLSPFNITNKCFSFDIADENIAFNSFNTSPFKPIDASTAAKTHTPDDRKPTRVSVNLCNKFEETPKNKLGSETFIKNINPTPLTSDNQKVEQSSNILHNDKWTITHTPEHHTSIFSK